ncbi:hypothetical protein BS47DRAFT_1302188, partial [Hydnum rufescens UP504]
ANAINPTTISGWFTLLQKTVNNYNIKPENTYGFDKTGFPIGKGQQPCVAAHKQTKTQHSTCGGGCENITVLETICADGTYLTPIVIFKANQVQLSPEESGQE